MSNMTAVEWLVEQYEKSFTLEINKVMTGIIEQAKAMEREQIEDAFQDGKWDWHDHIKNGIESKDLAQYYKETYKGKEQ